MATYNCEACEELKEVDAGLFVSGFGDDECTSMQNDTGLVSTSGNDDATDLTNMNDCLVGNLSRGIDSEAACDWKSFVKGLIDNLWTMFAALICAIKGIWTNIHSIWDYINTLCDSIDNILNLIQGASPTPHYEYYLDSFKSKLTLSINPSGSGITPSTDYLVPSFMCDILSGGGM